VFLSLVVSLSLGIHTLIISRCTQPRGISVSASTHLRLLNNIKSVRILVGDLLDASGQIHLVISSGNA